MRTHLRDYQERMISDIRREMAAGHRRILASLPTGGGKTKIALDIARAAAERGNRTGVLVERNTLVDQWIDSAAEEGIEAGVLQADRDWIGEHVRVLSQQTCESRERRGLDQWPDEQVVVVDECHADRKATRAWIRRSFPDRGRRICLGVTATPMSAGLGDTYSSLVSGPTTAALTSAGWLVPLQVFSAQADAVADMTGAAVNRANGEWTGEAIDERIGQIVGRVPEEWRRLTDELFGGPVSTLVFSATVSSGARLRDEFNRLAGARIAEQVSYLDTGDEDRRKEIIARFKSGETKVLVNVSVIGRGFDCPWARVLVDARPFRKSVMGYAQMIGRVLRPVNKQAEDGEKAYLFDHCANWDRMLGDVWSFWLHGVSELRPDDEERENEEQRELQTVDGGGEEEPPEWRCGECGRFNPLTSYRCECGGEKPERTRQVEGRLVEAAEQTDPVGVRMDVNCQMPSEYAYRHLYELALRHYLRRQASVTDRLRGKALKMAGMRFKSLYGFYPSFMPPTSREVEVDGRLSQWWAAEQEAYAAPFRARYGSGGGPQAVVG